MVLKSIAESRTAQRFTWSTPSLRLLCVRAELSALKVKAMLSYTSRLKKQNLLF